MADHLDAKTRQEFVQAVRGFLPKIRQGLTAFLDDVTQHEALEEAYEALHTLSDAALMLGLVELDNLASALEAALEDLALHPAPLHTAQSTWALETMEQLEPYLDSLLSGDGHDQVLAERLLQAFRNLPSLPPAPAATPLPPATHATQPLPEPVSPSGASTRTLDVSEELLAGFLTEAEDYLGIIGRALPELGSNPPPRELLQTVRRSVHTLKGAAGIVGFQDLAQLTHRLEDLLDALYDGRLALTTSVHELMFATFDVLDDFVRDQRGEGALAPTTEALYQSYARLLGDRTSTAARLLPRLPEQIPAESHDRAGETSAEPTTPAPPETRRPPSSRAANLVRVPIDRLDELVRLVSEFVIDRSVYEQHLSRLRRQVDELRLSMERLRRIASTVETQGQHSLPAHGPVLVDTPRPRVTRQATVLAQEFDELELERYSEAQLVSRELHETTADIGASEQEFRDILGDFDGYLTRQSRLTSEMQDKLMHLRMLPFATLATRLQRAVRVTARQQGKEAELWIEGEAIELDKTVLEEMAEPLLHLLRNAVDHGIEPPAQRQALGKPPRGQIRLRALTEGTQIVIQVSDDGAGLDPQRLRMAAIRGGFVTEADAAQLTQDQLYAFVFSPGLSTTPEINEVSGRGVGMDIVQTTVHRLKGSIELVSTPGQGLTCTMRFPLTLAIARVLLVKAHTETFAIPLADITRVAHLELEAIEQVDNVPVTRLEGQVIPVIRLGEKLQLRHPAETTGPRLPVVYTQVGDKQAAFLVDHLLGGREVVVKTLGSHLRRVHGIIGSTFMGDGSIVLILNVAELLRDARPQATSRVVALPGPGPRVPEGLDVLIVDDSFSVRRVVANVIRNAGWQPLLAKDGLEALEVLQGAARLPDTILLDIEMPHMDGYELTSTLRSHAAYRDIPIIMLTSRAGEKHRQKAVEVGVTAYLVKPCPDDVLLNLIRRLAPRAGDITAA